MKRALLLLAVFLTAACSHGRTPNFPTATDPAGAGQVAVVASAGDGCGRGSPGSRKRCGW